MERETRIPRPQPECEVAGGDSFRRRRELLSRTEGERAGGKGGPDLTHNGHDDAFVAKVNAEGTGLVYAGYIGGSSNDRGFGVAVDNLGHAYVAGLTVSTASTFPVTVGPDLTRNNSFDGFLAKVNPAGNGLIYASYIGGDDEDVAYGVAADQQGNAYVVGYTKSSEASFPVTVGPDVTHNSPLVEDAFIAKVNASGTEFLYAGYIGGLVPIMPMLLRLTRVAPPILPEIPRLLKQPDSQSPLALA